MLRYKNQIHLKGRLMYLSWLLKDKKFKVCNQLNPDIHALCVTISFLTHSMTVNLNIFPDVWMDIVQEFFPGWYHLLQFAYRCLWAKVTIQEGRIPIFRTSWSKMYPYWRYLCPPYKGLLHIWTTRESWSGLYRDEEKWPSPKYVPI